LIEDQIVMCHPERIKELLVMVSLVIGMQRLQGIAQSLADLHLFGETNAGTCPASTQPGRVLEDRFCRRRWGESQIESQLHVVSYVTSNVTQEIKKFLGIKQPPFVTKLWKMASGGYTESRLSQERGDIVHRNSRKEPFP